MTSDISSDVLFSDIIDTCRLWLDIADPYVMFHNVPSNMDDIALQVEAVTKYYSQRI
jgi:hypothetical protein